MAGTGVRPRPAGRSFQLVSDSEKLGAIQVRCQLGIDPYRGKTPCESAAAFFRGDADSALLFAKLVTCGRRRARVGFGGSVLARRTKTLEEIADQPSQTEIFRCEILHLHHRRNVETAKPSPPAVESPQRYPGSPANFRNGHAGAGLAEQMKNFIFRESGPSHRIALTQMTVSARLQSPPPRSSRPPGCHRRNLAQTSAAQKYAGAAPMRCATMLACLAYAGLICSPGLPEEINGAPPRNSRHARQNGMGIP
jgi:hypothetical protein